MKKLFFASALALGALCSCSNDDVVAPAADNGVGEETGLVPVQLTLNKPSVVASVRGIGTVGGVDVATNKWNGEQLYVFMMSKKDKDGNPAFEKSTWHYKDAESGAEENRINFYNAPLTAPVDTDKGDLYSTTVAAYDRLEPKFYPMDISLHDFFAYHIDDAAAVSDGTPTIDDTTDPTKITVDFKIDGSQDLMAGKAIPSADVAAVSGADVAKAYSAQSARAGVIPNIQMKHLLSRFTFEVQGGDDSANGLVVNKIEVKSKATGKMVVAYSSDLLAESEEALLPEDLISFDENEPVNLELKQRPAEGGQLESITPLTLSVTGGVGTLEPVGEALMVAPGETEYAVSITTTQQTGDLSNTFVHEGTINIPGGPAIAGTSYKVAITLFGASEIKVQTSLDAWIDGGPAIPVTPSDF